MNDTNNSFVIGFKISIPTFRIFSNCAMLLKWSQIEIGSSFIFAEVTDEIMGKWLHGLYSNATFKICNFKMSVTKNTVIWHLYLSRSVPINQIPIDLLLNVSQTEKLLIWYDNLAVYQKAFASPWTLSFILRSARNFQTVPNAVVSHSEWLLLS